MILSFIRDSFFLALQAASALGWGIFFLKIFGITRLDAEDHGILSLAAGYGIFSFFSFFMGLAGELRPLPILSIWILGLISLVIFKAVFGASDKNFRTSLTRLRVLFAIFLCAAVGNLLFSYAPPLRDDSIYIYMVFPRAYAAAGRLLEIPSNPPAYFPQAVEMLYTQLLLFSSPQSAKLLEWFFGILSAFTVARIAWSHCAARRPALIAAAWYTMPWITSLSGTGKIDLGSIFLALAAL